jgi:CHRD domain
LLATACVHVAAGVAERGRVVRTRKAPVLTILAVLIGLMTLGVATALAGTNRIELRADLIGANELPPADPDGRGDAEVTLKTNTNEICFALEWRRIGAPNRGHIHLGDSTVNGPVVVTFFDLVVPPAPPTDPLFDQLEKGRVRGCAPATAELIGQIAANPAGYYVNLHNARFPSGAIRGQLAAP